MILLGGRTSRVKLDFLVKLLDNHTWAFYLKVSLVSSDAQAMQYGMPGGILTCFA